MPLRGTLFAGPLRGPMVGVAQQVEHLVVVQDVAGSSPVTHPKEAEQRKLACDCEADAGVDARSADHPIHGEAPDRLRGQGLQSNL
jgi:hypothetical protein